MSKKIYERPFINLLNTNSLNKFGTQTNHKPVTQIDGVPVKKLIVDYGSPCFVFSEKTIRETYKKTLNSFNTRYPKVQFAWSYKTNYLNAVCNVFHQEGSWAEVVSMFEYDKALNSGVPGDKIIYNGPYKTARDLRKAIDNNSQIHIDHLDELYLLAKILETTKKKARVAIRVNMDTGVYPMWNRFGFNYEDGSAWSAINKIFTHPEMSLVGLHTHIGTYMMSANAYAVAAGKLCDLAFSIKKRYGKNIKYIDMGGGFASANTLKDSYLQGSDTIPTIDDYAEAITTTILNYGFKTEELPTLFLETGRALIDDAGYLLGTVNAIKRLNDGRRATILDFGLNLLFTSLWYEHSISPAQEMSMQSEDMTLYGPLCMNIDVVRDSINLPLLKAGDQVVVHRVGAYNMTQWMQFIHLRPNVVMIDSKGTPHIIKENETVETLLKHEKVPEHLTEFKL